MAKATKEKIRGAEGGQLDFETALARLEEIVERLDDGNLPLAQSLELFKEGTKLAARCRDLLSAAELAVKEVLRSERGDNDASNTPSDDEEILDGQDDERDQQDDGA